MWEPRRLTTLWASTACYRDRFTFTHCREHPSTRRYVNYSNPILKVNLRFGWICRLHLQGSSISKARNQLEIRWQAEPEFFVRNIDEFYPLKEPCLEFGFLTTVVMKSSSFFLPHAFTMVSCLAYAWTVKMESTLYPRRQNFSRYEMLNKTRIWIRLRENYSVWTEVFLDWLSYYWVLKKSSDTRNYLPYAK
jgi:hypothetical protein